VRCRARHGDDAANPSGQCAQSHVFQKSVDGCLKCGEISAWWNNFPGCRAG
jgi:ribosomal protein L40E